MDEILRAHNFVLRWHDSAHTIIVLEVLDHWTWENAYETISQMSQIVRSTPHQVYSVFWFKHEMPRLPAGLVLRKLHGLVLMGNKNEPLVLFVTSNGVLQTFLQITGRIYKLRDFLNKYRFMPTFEQALSVIEKHKKSAASLVE
jgi:hypothetical protein